jgi:hypothetical protein
VLILHPLFISVFPAELMDRARGPVNFRPSLLLSGPTNPLQFRPFCLLLAPSDFLRDPFLAPRGQRILCSGFTRSTTLCCLAMPSDRSRVPRLILATYCTPASTEFWAKDGPPRANLGRLACSLFDRFPELITEMYPVRVSVTQGKG